MELRSENEITQDGHSINQNLRKLCNEFSSNTTLHGYRYLVQERGSRKVMWIFSMLFAIIFSIWFFKDLLKNFNSKTKTIIQVDDNIQTLDFPTVSFCLSQPSFIQKYNLSTINVTQQEFAILYERFASMFMFKDTYNSFTDIVEKLRLANVTSYKSMLRLFDMTIEDILSDNTTFCKFEGENCKISDFKEVISPTGRLCISFNPYRKNADSKKSRKGSTEGGLTLFIDIKSQRTLLDVLSKQNY